jgi:hypothetical protein
MFCMRFNDRSLFAHPLLILIMPIKKMKRATSFGKGTCFISIEWPSLLFMTRKTR